MVLEITIRNKHKNTVFFLCILLFAYNLTFTFNCGVFGHKELLMKMSKPLITDLLIWCQMNLLTDTQILQSTLNFFFLSSTQLARLLCETVSTRVGCQIASFSCDEPEFFHVCGKWICLFS